jgi:hypothetical protein
MNTQIKTSAVMQRARALVNTSVQDMVSGLSHYCKREDLRVLAMGLIIVKQRGERTKIIFLERKIKQLRKSIRESEERHE